MTVVPVSGGMTERQVMLIQDFRPEVISCTPSYAQTLAEEFRKRGSPRRSSPWSTPSWAPSPGPRPSASRWTRGLG